MTNTQANSNQIVIDETLAHRLVATQFPQWKNLPIRAIIPGGWDNRTFRLGDKMLIRMPSTAEYAAQVEKEQHWLPRLTTALPFAIPIPLAMGESTEDYHWKWSIYGWLEGETVATAREINLNALASDLAQFLTALHRIDSTGGPEAGEHSFYRGGALAIYDAQTRQAITALKSKLDADAVTEIWETALTTTWNKSPVWIHGDISAGNLLVNNGALSAVIDFGQMAIGDPACDLAIAWTLFKDESRKVFRAKLDLDAGTWARGRAWTLWKSLIVAAGFTNPNNTEAAQSWRIIDDVLEDHRQRKDLV